ncbi:MAG: class I SAM-dependent methyltransferase [Proteobacteria bacterium]|nr:class I SAM-dependent methyltransferase [Pseudomonadota bacterium]
MESVVGSRIVRIRRKIENALCEWKLGIHTSGVYFSDSSNDEYIYYGTQSYATTRRILKRLALSPSDVLVDLGCGKGRVVCLASLYRLREVIGVEYSPILCGIAKENAIRLKGRETPIRIWEGLAQEFDYSQGSVFYMFHPFGPNTLKQVLANMRKGFEDCPRHIELVYVNPVHESILQDAKWLELQKRWEKGEHPDIDADVSFWRIRTQ